VQTVSILTRLDPFAARPFLGGGQGIAMVVESVN